MIYAAYLERDANGRYIYDAPDEEDAETMGEFLGDVAPGITNEAAPEIEPLVEGLKGGKVFRVTDESAPRGREVAYLIAWDGPPRVDIMK